MPRPVTDSHDFKTFTVGTTWPSAARSPSATSRCAPWGAPGHHPESPAVGGSGRRRRNHTTARRNTEENPPWPSLSPPPGRPTPARRTSSAAPWPNCPSHSRRTRLPVIRRPPGPSAAHGLQVLRDLRRRGRAQGAHRVSALRCRPTSTWCSAMRDAVNLAWRLDPVLAGRASTSVLDSYGPERLAHVAPLVQASLMTWSLAAETDPEKAAAGDAFLRPTQQRARTAERTAFRSGLPVPKRAAR